VVGTHLDKVAREGKLDRRQCVEELFRRLNCNISHDYHEVSAYPIMGHDEMIPGLKSLRNAILSRALELIHVNERVPKIFMELEEEITRLSEERKATKKGLTGLDVSVLICVFSKPLKFLFFPSYSFDLYAFDSWSISTLFCIIVIITFRTTDEYFRVQMESSLAYTEAAHAR
jgi:hypothetical protein